MSDRNDDELYFPPQLSLNYQDLPWLLQQVQSDYKRPSSKFRQSNELEIFNAANEYLKQKYQQLQNANEKRKGPKKVKANNYLNHVSPQYSDNQYPPHQSKSPHPKQAEKQKYLSQIEMVSPNKYNYLNGATNQSKDHENHDSHEYLNPTHLQMRQKYSGKKSSPQRYGINERVKPNINNAYHGTMGPDSRHQAQTSPPMLPPSPPLKYQIESVEEYVGNSGKEYETAAEKIVEGYMGEYMEKYMNEWYIKYCRQTGEYCDQIKTVHRHKGAEGDGEGRDNDYLHQLLRQEENLNVNQNAAKNNQYHQDDYLSFEKPPSQELQEQIDRDKFIHNFNEETLGLGNIPHTNHPFMDNNQLYYSSQSSRPQKPQNNFSPPDEPSHSYHDLDFGFYQNPRHKLFPNKDRQKKRIRKQQQRRKRLRQNQLKHSGPPLDSFLDLDYIEEMFAGSVYEDEDYPTNHQQKHHNKHYGYNGYSMIEETDIDSIDRSFRNMPRFFK